MTCVTPCLENKGDVEGSGTVIDFPGVRDPACFLVAVSKSGPAASNMAAFTPPPPGFSLLHGLRITSQVLEWVGSSSHKHFFVNLKITICVLISTVEL